MKTEEITERWARNRILQVLQGVAKMTGEYKIHITITKQHNIDERVLDRKTLEFSTIDAIVAWCNHAGVSFQ